MLRVFEPVFLLHSTPLNCISTLVFPLFRISFSSNSQCAALCKPPTFLFAPISISHSFMSLKKVDLPLLTWRIWFSHKFDELSPQQIGKIQSFWWLHPTFVCFIGWLSPNRIFPFLILPIISREPSFIP